MSDVTEVKRVERQQRITAAVRRHIAINRRPGAIANDVPADADHGLLLRARLGDEHAQWRVTELFDSKEIRRRKGWKLPAKRRMVS